MKELTKQELTELLGEYGIEESITYEMIDSSHGEDDLRLNYIINQKYVLRINSAAVMSDERLRELNSLIARYNKFGLKAPYFIADEKGHFLHKNHENYVYLSEYLDGTIADDVKEDCFEALVEERLRLVARYAQMHKNVDLIQTRSMYSLFDLSPYDLPYGIDEKQDNLNELVATLKEIGENELAEQFIIENETIRKELLAVYKTLPCCVFQGDENFSNVCVDEDQHIIGIFDFNMSGTDVNANYLANLAFQGRFFYSENTFDEMNAEELYDKVLDSFRQATKLIEHHYLFTEVERKAYYLYAKIVLISGYVNVNAFQYYLERLEYRTEAISLLRKFAKLRLCGNTLWEIHDDSFKRNNK